MKQAVSQQTKATDFGGFFICVAISYLMHKFIIPRTVSYRFRYD